MSRMRVVSARSVLQSIREGLNRQQLMEKHGLSPATLRDVLNQIREEKDRRASRIIRDFLMGMEVQDIAKRNEFAVGRFLDILRKAVCLQLSRTPDLTVETDTTAREDADGERRRFPRIRCPVLKGHVRDVSCPGREGAILDISEKGLGVRGIPAEVDDEKTFQIAESKFDLPDPIVLTCKCRWTGKTEHPDFDRSAGFEIIAISESDKRYLRSWIDAEASITSPHHFV